MLARRSLEEGFASEATPKSGFTTGQVSLHHFSSGTIKARWRLHNTFGQPRYSSEACFSATTACGSCVWARQQRWCMSLARLGLFFSEGIHVSSQPTAQLRTHTHTLEKRMCAQQMPKVFAVPFVPVFFHILCRQGCAAHRDRFDHRRNLATSTRR